MTRPILVIGSGAGGAAAARALQGPFQVTVLEAGSAFRPMTLPRNLLEPARRTGLFFNPRLIRLIFPHMHIHNLQDMILVRGIGTGGTTPLSTGNAVRADSDFNAAGLNLDDAFHMLSRLIPVNTDHESRWSSLNRMLFDHCKNAGMNPLITPKMGRHTDCRACGQCVLGCPYGVKWDSRRFLSDAQQNGARILTRHPVHSLCIRNGRIQGVWVRKGPVTRFMEAETVILAAGGLGTPAILRRSGIPVRPSLFVDPVLTVTARIPGACQHRDIPMPFIIQKQGYMLSPYFDLLSFYFHRQWRHPARDLYGIMIKLADVNAGEVTSRSVHKPLTAADRENLTRAVEECQSLLAVLGVRKKDTFLGLVNAGHPGGCLPMDRSWSSSFHPPGFPQGLYVADASLFPRSPGNPPSLTIMALAQAISTFLREQPQH